MLVVVEGPMDCPVGWSYRWWQRWHKSFAPPSRKSVALNYIPKNGLRAISLLGPALALKFHSWPRDNTPFVLMGALYFLFGL